MFHALYVTSVSSIKAFMAALVDHYGRIDVLINNAGYNKLKKTFDCDRELYDFIVDADLKNVFFCSQIAAKQMIEQGSGGSIVNISSQAGVVGAAERGPCSGARGSQQHDKNHGRRVGRIRHTRQCYRPNSNPPTPRQASHSR